jgi:hypothetical protein
MTNKRIVPIGSRALTILSEIQTGNLKKYDSLAEASKG